MTREVRVAIPGRIVYVTGTVNEISYPFTRNQDGIWCAVVARAASDIYRLSLTAIDDAGTTGTFETTVYYGAQLVTDRSAADVVNQTPKGFYHAGDLNRVGYATKYIGDQIRAEGFLLDTAPKLDWTESDIPQSSQMNRYLGDVRRVKETLKGSAPLPDSMQKLGWDGANQIERALLEAKINYSNMCAAYYYSDEIYGGEV